MLIQLLKSVLRLVVVTLVIYLGLCILLWVHNYVPRDIKVVGGYAMCAVLGYLMYRA